MPIVLDCSTTMGWCFADEASRLADRTLDALQGSEGLVPSIWTLEVINVLLVAERHGRLTEAGTMRFLDLLGDLPIRVEERDASVAFGSVLACGRRFGLTSYDCGLLGPGHANGHPASYERPEAAKGVLRRRRRALSRHLTRISQRVTAARGRWPTRQGSCRSSHRPASSRSSS